MKVSFCAVIFSRDVLGEILDLIESVSDGFSHQLPVLLCVLLLINIHYCHLLFRVNQTLSVVAER